MDTTNQAMAEEKRRVAANSVFAAIAITGLKAVVGIATGSLGILSEALHSALDLVAAVITLISVRVSDRPADESHHYGHGKFENFSAFIETGLLGLTCVWIVYEAVKRLVFKNVEVEPSVAAFVVMAFSIGTDVWRSRALKRVAVKYDSQALEADALHFSTDIWSSCAVIVGLAVVYAGKALHMPALQVGDPVAALFVAAIVMTVTWRLGRETIDALVDAAPAGLHDRVVDAVSNVPGVLSTESVRLRRSGNRTFADVRVALARTLSFERTEAFSKEVADAVHSIAPNAEVTVRAVPRASLDESMFDVVRAVAARHGVAVRDLGIVEEGISLDLEPFLEFDGSLTLKAVHDRVDAIEREITAEFSRVRSIVTHVAPAGGIAKGAEAVEEPQLEAALRAAAMEVEGILDVHDFRLRRVGDQLDVSCHCLLADDVPLKTVHDKLLAAEQRVRAVDQRLGRIVLHPEPVSEG